MIGWICEISITSFLGNGGPEVATGQFQPSVSESGGEALR